jgi:hypothetical protein
LAGADRDAARAAVDDPAVKDALKREVAQAIAAGGEESDLRLTWIHDENSVRNDIDGDVFFEARIGVAASARPRRSSDPGP